MENFNRMVIGVKTGRRMFRFPGKSGEVIDELLSSRGHGRIRNDYFHTVHQYENGTGSFAIKSEDESTDLTLQPDNVIFGKSDYTNGAINAGSHLQDFVEIFSIINKILKFDEVRRVGIVIESQFKAGNDCSQKIIDNITNLGSLNPCAEARIRFIERAPDNINDISADSFCNTIYEIYDSASDKDNSNPGFININIDNQMYFNPLISHKSVLKEARELFSSAKKKRELLIQKVNSSGLLNYD